MVTDVFDFMKPLMKKNPNHVVINIGTNDLSNTNLSLHYIANNISSLTISATNHGIKWSVQALCSAMMIFGTRVLVPFIWCHQKHDYANYDQFAPNFAATYKTIQCVTVPNWKLFGPTETELWIKEVRWCSIMLYGKMDWWAFVSPPAWLWQYKCAEIFYTCLSNRNSCIYWYIDLKLVHWPETCTGCPKKGIDKKRLSRSE